LRLSVVLFTIFFVSSACAPSDEIETVFDPCSPLAIVPGEGSAPSERDSIEQAIDAWNRVLPTRLEVGPHAGVPELPVYFLSDIGFRAAYFDKSVEIVVSRDKLAPDDLGLAIAHELGHSFGLFHVSKKERLSVMNVGNLEVEPNREDALAVASLWEACLDQSTDAL
jgi:hypothetical protein